MKITLSLISALMLCVAVSAQTFRIGADYYPEQYPQQQVSKDALFMKKAGLNMVRMADFAWFKLQPDAQHFTLDWLQRAVDTLGKNGINTLLATPTAAIPKWMFDMHPDIMQVTETGVRKPYGKRRHACLNNPTYKQYSKQIAQEMAKQFANNNYVVGFQIDNELMAEEPFCYCNYCKNAFATWLEKKYTTISTLNKAWGLDFWSQNLTSFSQVFLPRKGDNPGCFNDYQAFYSDCTINYFKLQRDAIKQINPRFKITHNICSSGFLYRLDMYKLSQYCDFLSIDNYPYTWTLENEYGPVDQFDFHPAMASMSLSQIRGTQHQAFWVTEAQISRTAGKQRKMIPPGLVRLWTHQERAHGAETVLFFPYRTFEAAHEHMMNGIMDADNVPRRRYFEVQQTAAELSSLQQQLGFAMPKVKAAIIRDFVCDWAFEDGRFSADFRYMRHIYQYYKALHEKQVMADLVSPNDDFQNYSLIIVPAQVSLKPALLQKLRSAAERGSTVVITCMTGLRDSSMHAFGGMINKGVEQLAGIQMQEQFSIIQAEKTAIQYHQKSNNDSLWGSLWFDALKPLTAQVKATYTNKFLKNQPAVTVQKTGKGSVWYIGTIPSPLLTQHIVTDVLASAGIVPLAKAQNNQVEITELQNGTNKFLYIINFSNQEQHIQLFVPTKSLLTQKIYTDSLTVGAMDIQVLQIENKK